MKFYFFAEYLLSYIAKTRVCEISFMENYYNKPLLKCKLLSKFDNIFCEINSMWKLEKYVE